MRLLRLGRRWLVATESQILVATGSQKDSKLRLGLKYLLLQLGLRKRANCNSVSKATALANGSQEKTFSKIERKNLRSTRSCVLFKLFNEEQITKEQMKQTTKDRIEQIGIKYNSLTKPEAIALICGIIAEETGIEPADALPILEELDALNAINTSAMRQKINSKCFGKTESKAKKLTAFDLAKNLMPEN